MSISQDTMTNNGSLARSKTAPGELETKAFPLSPKLKNRPLQEKTLEQGNKRKRTCAVCFLCVFSSLCMPPFIGSKRKYYKIKIQ